MFLFHGTRTSEPLENIISMYHDVRNPERGSTPQVPGMMWAEELHLHLHPPITSINPTVQFYQHEYRKSF